MKPIFTIHAGEYLVGDYLERKLNHFGYNIWIPSKDDGIDLLVTDKYNKRNVSLQVKFSKDYTVTHNDPLMQEYVLCGGWNVLNTEKIRSSKADLWVFVVYPFFKKKSAQAKKSRRNAKGKSDVQFVVIRPSELLARLEETNGTGKTSHHLYLTIGQGRDLCLNTRALKNGDAYFMDPTKRVEQTSRDFSSFLNNWGLLHSLLGNPISV